MPWCFSDMKCLINVISGKNVVTELPTRISETKIQSLLKTARFWFFNQIPRFFLSEYNINKSLYFQTKHIQMQSVQHYYYHWLYFYLCNPFSITIIIELSSLFDSTCFFCFRLLDIPDTIQVYTIWTYITYIIGS